MRRDLTIAVSAVCVTVSVAALLVTVLVSVFVLDVVRGPLPPAHGQTTGEEAGGYIIATGQSQGGSDQVLWVLETKSQRLTCYGASKQGIEYRGVRQITWDLLPEDYSSRGKSLTVDEVREAARKARPKPGAAQP